MPAEFDKCVSSGGRVRTKKLSGGRYMRVCFLKGKSYAGHVRKAKGNSKARGTPPMLAAMRAHKKR